MNLNEKEISPDVATFGDQSKMAAVIDASI